MNGTDITKLIATYRADNANIGLGFKGFDITIQQLFPTL